MSKISEYLNKIKTAIYGREVRDAIHDSIKECYADVTRGATLANAASDKANAATEKANIAASNADTATASANSAANLANTAASNADNKAALADEATKNANAATESANAAASNATDKAALADTAATGATAAMNSANEAASNANGKATLANEAAANANAATESANTAASNADNKAALADKATTNANSAANLANTAATTADNKAALADNAAGLIRRMDVSTTHLPPGSAPTSSLNTVEDTSGLSHYSLVLGIPTGNTGATPALTFEVSTGEAGTSATVEVTGTAEAPIVHLTIPKGDTGKIENLVINGKPVDNGTITLTASDVGALSGTDSTLAIAGEAADAQKVGTELNQLKNEIAAQESSIGDAWMSGKTYTVGDYCISRNQLYKCKTAHTAGSTFNLGYWVTSNVCAEIKANNDTYTIDASKFFADNSKIDTASILKCGNVVRLTIKFNSISFSEDDVLAKINPEYTPKAVTYTTGFIYGLDTAIDITLTSWGDIKVFGMHTIESKRLYIAVTYII